MRNIVYKGFVIEPSVELVPNITISPFCKGFDLGNVSIDSKMNVSMLDVVFNDWGGVNCTPNADWQ